MAPRVTNDGLQTSSGQNFPRGGCAALQTPRWRHRARVSDELVTGTDTDRSPVGSANRLQQMLHHTDETRSLLRGGHRAFLQRVRIRQPVVGVIATGLAEGQGAGGIAATAQHASNRTRMRALSARSARPPSVAGCRVRAVGCLRARRDCALFEERIAWYCLHMSQRLQI